NSPFTTDDEFKNVEAECSLPFTVVTDINSKSNADSHTHRCKCRGTCQARCSCRRSGRPFIITRQSNSYGTTIWITRYITSKT
ncbi:unnamed protein product, partial [Schistosoma intercalatum]